MLYWVRERERIRVRKENGDIWPWTDDPILRQYSFCCVRREDDRVTRWIAANIREPFAHSSYLWLMLCIARQINWDSTLAALIKKGAWPNRRDFRPENITVILEMIRARSEKWHTGAYMIRAESSKDVPWFSWPKTRYIAEIVIGRLWDARGTFTLLFAEQPTMQAVHAELMKYRGWGPFMAGQAVVDMMYCSSLLLDAPDRNRWMVAGPGTLRGLNRLHGRDKDYRLGQEQALEEMLALHEVLRQEIDLDLPDTSSCCCEFDKYLRVKLGEGRPRALYRPPAQT